MRWLASFFLSLALLLPVPGWAADYAIVRQQAPGATGNQSFTESGFGTPKGAMCFTSYATTNATPVTSAGLGIGFTDGTRQEYVVGGSEDNVNPTDVGGATGTDAVIAIGTVTAPDTLDGKAAFNAWVTDGLQVNWSNVPSTTVMVTCVLFGGTAVTDVYVGNVTNPATLNTATDVTAPAFQPTFIITAGRLGGTDHRLSVGFADGTTQKSVNIRDADSGTATQQSAYVASDCVGINIADGTAPRTCISLEDFDSSGFSAYTRDEGTNTWATSYMAVKLATGLGAKVLAYPGPTGTGTDSVTGAGFKPQFGMILLSDGAAEDTWYTVDAGVEMFGWGVFNSTSEGSVAVEFEDNLAPAAAYSDSLTDAKAVYLRKDNADEFIGTLSTFDSDGVTMTYSTADTTSRTWALLLLQENVAASAVGRRRTF